MKIRNLVWCLLLPVLITRCAAPSGQATPDTAAPTQIATAMAFIPSATPTILPPPTDTITPSPSSTPANTFPLELPESIQQNCLEILPVLPADKTYNGKIVFLGKIIYTNIAIGPYFEEASFYDLKTRQIHSISQYKVKNIVVSPDRTKYALLDAIDHQIKVFSAEGRLLSTVPQGTEPWVIGEWLDNERLVLVIVKPLEGTDYIIYPQDMVIVNPFTKEQIYLPSDYPDMDRANARMSWEGGGTTKYDPTLTRGVYAAPIAKDYIGSHGQGYVLWDMVNQKKLVEVVTGNFVYTPKWSPDGSKFVVNDTGGEFFTISRDGKVTQITYFNTASQKTTSNMYYLSDMYTWSPDGRYLALWLTSTVNEDTITTFAIIDMITGSVTDYCISAGSAGGNDYLSWRYRPIWSPDGKNVAIIANRQEDRKFDTLLLDMEGGGAVKLGENLSPIGWLDTGE